MKNTAEKEINFLSTSVNKDRFIAFDNELSLDEYPSIEDEINLIELLMVLLKRKFLLVAIVIIGLAAFFLFAKLYNHTIHESRLSFSLVFNGIEKHLNPDGSEFEKEQIIHPNILAKVSSRYSAILNENSERPLVFLQNHLVIEPIFPEDIKKKLEEEEVVSFFPNRFELLFRTDEKLALSNAVKEEIIIAVLAEYENQFDQRYLIQPQALMRITSEMVSESDYRFFSGLATNKINTTIAFINKQVGLVGDFRANSSLRSFNDTANDLMFLRDTKIQQLNDIVKNLRLAKDKRLFAIHLQEEVNRLNREINKSIASATIAEKLLNDTKAIQSPNIRFTEIPVEPSLVNQLRQDDRTLFLIKHILSAETTAKHLEIEKKAILEDLDAVQNETSEVPQRFIPQAGQLMLEIASDYNTLLDETEAYYNEFKTTNLDNSIRHSAPPYSIAIHSLDLSWKLLAIAGFALLLVGVLVVFLLESIQKYKNSNAGQL